MSRIKLNGETPIPVAWLFASIGAAALAGGAWFVTRRDVAQQEESLKAVKQEIVSIQALRTADREMLVRIDERTAQMKADQDKLMDRLFPPAQVASK